MRTWQKIALLPLLMSISTLAIAGPSGKEIFDGVVANTPIMDDEKLANYIGGLVSEIVSVSEMKGKKFTFTLLDSPDVNAFATADNYVYVNRGLLNYVSNEAQLVSVMAHEVAHVTKGHVNSMEGKASGAQFLAALAAMLSGSPEVYSAGMEYANSLIKGHGRNNELEADRAAAEYMAKLGYDPENMIDMLSVMKDMETLNKDRAAAQGATKQTYHGIFSSHPRNDSRLRNAVTNAKSEGTTEARDAGADTYREMTDGMVWGENFAEKESKPNRYAHEQLRVRFDFPEEWSHELID
ncbi:MAG: putative Zn-dependent protease, partial [Lysobacterales bacterium]